MNGAAWEMHTRSMYMTIARRIAKTIVRIARACRPHVAGARDRLLPTESGEDGALMNRAPQRTSGESASAKSDGAHLASAGSSLTAIVRQRQNPPGTQRVPPWTWMASGPSVMPSFAWFAVSVKSVIC